MLFACSGVPLPDGTTREHLTRFVTSAALVRVFDEKRNRDDKLRVGAANYCPPFCWFIWPSLRPPFCFIYPN